MRATLAISLVALLIAVAVGSFAMYCSAHGIIPCRLRWYDGHPQLQLWIHHVRLT